MPIHHHRPYHQRNLLIVLQFAIVTTLLLSSSCHASTTESNNESTSSSSCSSSSSSNKQAVFSCPNCGGISVSDCALMCDGYTFTDYGYQLCYDRQLFHVKENEPGDSDHHYPFLWADLWVCILMSNITNSISYLCWLCEKQLTIYLFHTLHY